MNFSDLPGRKDVQRWSKVKRTDSIECRRTASTTTADEDGEIREQTVAVGGSNSEDCSPRKNRGTIVVLTTVDR